MWKHIFTALLGLAAAPSWAGATLTRAEAAWIEAAAPVVAYARTQSLALDVVVPAQAHDGDSPIAMGYAQQRCKLVFTLKDSHAVMAALDGVADELVPAVIEAMAAHELGHCWRYASGHWFTLPAGFVDTSRETERAADAGALQRWQDMRATRREEGFADLVALAWTARHHPQHYAAVHAWLARSRADQPVPGSHHDTRAWVRLAHERASLGDTDALFDAAASLWMRGLQADD